MPVLSRLLDNDEGKRSCQGGNWCRLKDMEDKTQFEKEILEWISSLIDRRFTEFFYKMAANRNTADTGEGHFVLADTWKLPEDPWSVDLVTLPSSAERHLYPEDAIIREIGECNTCRSLVRSWAKHASCPVCGVEIYCT